MPTVSANPRNGTPASHICLAVCFVYVTVRLQLDVFDER